MKFGSTGNLHVGTRRDDGQATRIFAGIEQRPTRGIEITGNVESNRPFKRECRTTT